jgi:hypothetical protein
MMGCVMYLGIGGVRSVSVGRAASVDPVSISSVKFCSCLVFCSPFYKFTSMHRTTVC